MWTWKVAVWELESIFLFRGNVLLDQGSSLLALVDIRAYNPAAPPTTAPQKIIVIAIIIKTPWQVAKIQIALQCNADLLKNVTES